MASGPITSGKINGETMETVQTLFSWAPKSLVTVTAAMKLKRHLLLRRKTMTSLDSILKKKKNHFPYKGPSIQSYGFSSSHVQI